MIKLMNDNHNIINRVKTNMAVSWRNLIAQAAKEAKADTVAARLIDPNAPTKEEVATLLLLVINRGLTIYEIYGVPSYGLPRGKNAWLSLGASIH